MQTISIPELNRLNRMIQNKDVTKRESILDAIEAMYRNEYISLSQKNIYSANIRTTNDDYNRNLLTRESWETKVREVIDNLSEVLDNLETIKPKLYIYVRDKDNIKEVHAEGIFEAQFLEERYSEYDKKQWKPFCNTDSIEDVVSKLTESHSIEVIYIDEGTDKSVLVHEIHVESHIAIFDFISLCPDHQNTIPKYFDNVKSSIFIPKFPKMYHSPMVYEYFENAIFKIFDTLLILDAKIEIVLSRDCEQKDDLINKIKKILSTKFITAKKIMNSNPDKVSGLSNSLMI